LADAGAWRNPGTPVNMTNLDVPTVSRYFSDNVLKMAEIVDGCNFEEF